LSTLSRVLRLFLIRFSMTTLVVSSHLEANLASLGERNADLRERLTAALPPPDLVLCESAQRVLAGTLDGRPLCSKHRPLDEADRLVRDIDLVEHAVIVVLGFGLGWHVKMLAERAAKATLIVVFEPDLALLRGALEHIDHSPWMRDALLLFVTDADDRGALARKLDGAESILGQGVHFLEHPASAARLGELASRFATSFKNHVAAAKVTLSTTLMRSVETVRNLMLNLDHYAAGAGIADLHNGASGCPAVIVSAGPSLHKNIHHLASESVREKCVIIAVQTALKPLLSAGVKPHFVTALDYHEISKRFYEDLNPDDLRTITLVADPKVHPLIPDIYPGPIRCCANSFLDKLLGPMKRDMGDLPAGATVAHLAVYLARYLGCNPIAMIGQDLGFPDGLYYAPGTAIHDVWAPELNPFNTIAMMEWQRIARHRLHLIQTRDVHGKSIYTDAQMHTYLQQFERDFAQYKAEGVTIIDATEGGVAKQHTVAMPLREALSHHATRPLPTLPLPPTGLDQTRIAQVRGRLNTVRNDVERLRDVSAKTRSLLQAMIEHQHDQVRMKSHFQRIDRYRAEVERRMKSFELLNHINQMGVFRRLKADRRLHMQPTLDAMAKQRLQLERDAENVNWIADAAAEMLEQISLTQRVLEGEKIHSHAGEKRTTGEAATADALPSKVAALIPIDPERNGLGIPRSLADTINGASVLQATLARLGRSQTLESIIVIAPKTFDLEALIDQTRIGLPLDIEWVEGSPFGPEHTAVAAARLWADTCWRGGIAGMSIYDEVLCPQMMYRVMRDRGLTAALLVGPDWPLVNVIDEGGCDSIVRRHLENPTQLNLVFTQAPPGTCGCLISATLMAEMSPRNRLSTVGGLLVYQPHAPQHDPIARDVNVQIDHRVRQGLVRATFDSPRQRELINSALNWRSIDEIKPTDVVAALADAGVAPVESSTPHHLILELTPRRCSAGLFAQSLGCPVERPRLTPELAVCIFKQLADIADLAVTFAGAGDPLLHPHFDTLARLAKQHGARGVHIRTELLVDHQVIDRLLNCGVDVISVDLNADRAATYQTMMGCDRFKDVLMNIEYVLQRRQRLTSQPGTAAIALPWVVPHLQRCAETYEDIDSFFDRWQHTLGCAVIADPPIGESGVRNRFSLTPAVTPRTVIERDLATTLTILCDGSIPVDPVDLSGANCAGNVADQPLMDLWSAALASRFINASNS
jgi:hypothetical protein